MPRGVSITPQGRGGYTTIPEDLQYSLFEYPKDLLGSNNNNNSNHNVRDAVFMDSWAKVRVFDDEGNLTVRQEGVRAFRFRQLAWFHALRSQSWSWLVGFSILVYLLIVLLFSVMYLVWSGVCGGASRSTSPHTNGIIALYFTVVSLAANGGYLGEEPTMIDPTSTCYAGRSVIVMGCSYVNILFVGLVAALVVGKAESTARLGHRIVFSSYCTLNTTTTEEKGGRASSRGGAASRRGRAAAPSWKLTFRMASMENLKPLAHGRLRLFCVSAESSSVYHEERRRRREREEHQKLHQRGDDDGAEDVAPNTTATPTAENGGGRGRKGRPSHVSPPSSTSPKRQRHPRAPSVSTSSSSASDGDDGDNDAVLDSQQRRGRAREGRTDYGATATRATVDEHGIMKGDGGIAPLSSSSSPARSPTTSHVVDSLAAAVDMRRPHISNNNNISSGSINTSELRRAHMCVTELEWSCPEERYLRDGPRGQLSLWYPATITHIIDENSPLYRFMHQPRRGADLLCPDAACCAPGGGDAAACCAHVGASDGSTDGADFQIVAVFDATDMDTSAIIMAKHTYITTDLVAHHRFSSKLVRIHPKSGGIRLDFHHFNDLVPTASQELTSTTNSD